MYGPRYSAGLTEEPGNPLVHHWEDMQRTRTERMMVLIRTTLTLLPWAANTEGSLITASKEGSYSSPGLAGLHLTDS